MTRTRYFFCTPIAMLMAVIGVASLAGCGGDDGTVHVSGTATFDGKPIVYGDAQFVPDASKSHSGAGCMATILDGKYTTTGDGGSGITPGPYLVRVTAYPGKPPPPPPLRPEVGTGASRDVELQAPESDGMGAPLFVAYELSLDLQGSTADIAVPAEAKGHGLGGNGSSRRRPGSP